MPKATPAVVPVAGDAAAPAQMPKLLAMAPEQYVVAAFQSLDAEVAAAIERVGKVVHDVSTPEGMDAAKADRNVFRELRWATDRHHKDVKAPVLQLSRLIDGHWNQLKDQLAPYEAHYNDPIEAEEARKAAQARAREHAEMERISTLERQVAALTNAPAQALGQPASIIETVLLAVEATIVDERYAEYEQMAMAAKDKAVADLRRALAQALDAEANQAELERLRLQLAATPVAPDAWAPTPTSAPGDTLLRCYRYLIGLDTDYPTLLAEVENSLAALGIELPSH